MQKGPALLPHPRLPAPPPPPPSLRAEPRKTEPTCDLLQGFKHLKLLRLQGGQCRRQRSWKDQREQSAEQEDGDQELQKALTHHSPPSRRPSSEAASILRFTD